MDTILVLQHMLTYLQDLKIHKNTEYKYDIWDDKILNPSLSIEASKQKKLI